MQTRWSQRLDPDSRRPMPSEYEGEIKGEPSFALRASPWTWSVWIEGVEARAGRIGPLDVDRACRFHRRRISALELAKMRAEAWAADVIDRRSQAEDDVLP